MKKYLLVLSFFAASFTSKAQAQYEVIREAGTPPVKILKGLISKDLIKNDTAFKNWYAANTQYYGPDSNLVKSFSKIKTDSLQIIAFGGTWCEDTQFILPKFFKLQELSGVPEDNITLFGVTRNKKTIGHIAEALGIVNVPTFIVMKNGKELGRVVEYGNTGKWDQELADIINKN